MNEILEILDERALVKAMRGRIGAAEILEQELRELVARAAKRPSEFSELWPKIMEKRAAVRELRNPPPPPFTREQKDAIVEAVATLFKNRRR